jgi:Zn-dependent protease
LQLSFDPADLILWFVVFLFSLSLHESAHAFVSERFGDYTGRYQGRITLNPLAHIDLFGTIVFPLVGFITGAALLGWAKPVQTNPLLWRDKKKANVMVSAAGPISNFLLATIGFIILKALLVYGLVVPHIGRIDLVAPVGEPGGLMAPISKLLSVLLSLNLALGILNLIPIPPLDGSHVLETFLPYEIAKAYDQIRPFGMILLLAMLWFGVFGFIFIPIRNVVLTLLYGPGYSIG